MEKYLCTTIEVRFELRMLVDRTRFRCPGPVEFDRRIMAERLEKDRLAARTQHPSDLPQRDVEHQMVEDAAAEYQVEAFRWQFHRLGVLDLEGYI